MEKLERLTINEHHKKFRDFIVDVLLEKKVPDECFIERSGSITASSRGTRDCTILQNTSRYKYIIKNSLKNLHGRQRHYVVLKHLVEHDLTNAVVCEVPVWKKNDPPNKHAAGHIDMIEFFEKTPSIVIQDYKPMAFQIDPPSGQLLFYQSMISQMLDIPYSEVGIGYFDEVVEIMLVDV